MKKRILSIFLCLVMVFSLLPFTASAAGATPIDEKNFPDPVFREYVRKVAGSTYLNDTIVRQIEVLDVSDDNIKEVLGKRDPITSLKGIRYLKYVKDLNCSGQKLKTLNLELNSRVEKLNCSGNQLTDLWLDPRGNSLKYLTCSVNELTALDLSKSSELTELSCSSNKLTALDLSANTKLQKIIAQMNALTTLDTRNLPELTYLNLWGNHDLTSIDVSKNTKLEILSASHGKLTSLNVSNNRKLVELYVYDNQLTALDVRSNYLLKNLSCYENQITALDVSNNVALESLGVNDNPITELNLHPLSNLQVLSCNEMKLTKLDVSRCTELLKLYCNDNQIETLDLRSNKKLRVLQCQNNRLSWLDLSSNTELDTRYVNCSGNVYDIKVDENLQYKVYPDLPCYGATEGTYFTAARASDWTGGTVSKVDGWDVLTLDNRDVKEVTYKYDTGNDKIGKVAFTLKTEVPAKYITISFDPNGGTGTMKPMRVKAGENYTLPECTFTPPEGREFAGWLAVNGTVYPAGTKVISSYDQSFKATWKDKEAAEVTISFDPNGGTGTMQPMKVKSGENFTLPECTFTPPEGKEFAGWLAANGNVYPAGDIAFSTTDTVLKATWKDKEAETPHEHSYKAVVTAPTCTEKGYTTHTCACGDSYVDTYVDALGHAWDSGKVTKQPTATEDGVKTYTCTRCGETKTETISATGCPSAGFTDVPGEDNWAHAGIDYCVANGLMSGIGNDLFGPKLTTTRAQIVQILYNLEGEPKVSGTTPFTDLTQDWYQDAVLWAYQTGVVAGTSSTTFEPDLPVTREQIAVILMEYVTRVLKLERTWTPADLSTFPDAGSVSDWAKDALADAVALGLISGASNGGQTLLEPQGSATREQVATILMEFCKNVKK